MTTALTLLGTAGGPAPKRTRAAPAQVIAVDGDSYVVDCGNGVARQLVLAGIDLSHLRSILLTHHHSDHNADYGNLLLLAWAANLQRTVPAYGPPPILEMTRAFFELNRFDVETRIEDEGLCDPRPLLDPHEIASAGLIYQDEKVRVTAARVDHPPIEIAFAYRFDTADRSIVISGDTAPCENLVRLAEGADLLVHEVMYAPAIAATAARYGAATRLREHLAASHTSVADVGAIAQRAGVRTLVLSHFVPTDADIADQVWHEQASQGFDGEVIVGRDLLTL
ncbi:MAG: MBL fold metallo-hydrolase [Candidatus Dormibacteraceae bacterium]